MVCELWAFDGFVVDVVEFESSLSRHGLNDRMVPRVDALLVNLLIVPLGAVV